MGVDGTRVKVFCVFLVVCVLFACFKFLLYCFVCFIFLFCFVCVCVVFIFVCFCPGGGPDPYPVDPYPVDPYLKIPNMSRHRACLDYYVHNVFFSVF